MKTLLKTLIALPVLLVALYFIAPLPAQAAGPTYVTVGWGDTLYSIAARYNTSTGTLVSANRLPNPDFVFAGQRLVIPGRSTGSGPSGGGSYIIRPGDTLVGIAVKNKTTVNIFMLANGLANPNLIYWGMRLNIPNPGAGTSKPPDTVGNPPTQGKWIDVNLRTQRFTAYEGSRPVLRKLRSGEENGR